MLYPTKKEILEKRPDIDPAMIKIVLSWKKKFMKDWKNATNSNKIMMLRALIYALVVCTHPLLKKPKKEIPKVELGPIYCYEKTEKTIYLEGHNPSIISTLHELAHHFFGDSELEACRWSIWLFKECFPTLYNNLTWKGHQLVK